MATYLSLEDRVNSWLELGSMIGPAQLPADIEAAALQANPWFTPYYIRRALTEIQAWFDEEMIWQFLRQYDLPSSSDKVIGLIAAGNIPLVGVHDLFISVLSGHITQLKPSHQDQVLLQWIIDKWCQILTPLSARLHIVKQLHQPDFFIGTGSNNTARYLRSHFANIPNILRKNRFSVAFIDRELQDEEWQGLLEDILLYNGTGCRNVSQIVTLTPSGWKH
ncbi:MAG: acyl-CoA reductase, partial [Bacteroidota bacterium]